MQLEKIFVAVQYDGYIHQEYKYHIYIYIYIYIYNIYCNPTSIKNNIKQQTTKQAREELRGRWIFATRKGKRGREWKLESKWECNQNELWPWPKMLHDMHRSWHFYVFFEPPK
jgi:hypothetical protein